MGKSRRIIPRLKFTSPFTTRRGFKGRQADEVDIADEFDEFDENDWADDQIKAAKEEPEHYRSIL